MSETATDRLGRVVLAFLWFDLGLLILLLPWSRLWESNPFLVQYPGLIPYMLSGYVRGVVSGIGLVDMIMAADALVRRSPASIATRH
jgi:hypothetical protein